MWNKIMPGVKRWVSRYLVVAMMMTFVFSNSFACSVFAAPDEGGERAATASDAIRDSRVKLLNKGKDDVQIVVMSDSAGYEAGDTVCLELYIKNNTGKTITDGKLKYSGGKILEDSAYFEDLSAMYEEEEFQEERSEEQDMMPADSKSPVLESVLEQMEEEAEAALERLELEAEAGAEVVQKALEGAAKAEEEAKVLENDSEQGEEEEMDDTPDHLENLVIQPGQSYYVNFYYTIDDEIKGIKGQTLNFSFRGKTEEGKQVSGKESFRYTIGALNLRPVVFAEGSRLLTGEEHEMVLDFDIGELQEILEEAELEAIDREEQKEEEIAGEETASPSEGRPASASQADGKGNSASYKGSKASDSDGLKDTPSNTWAQWGENDSQNLGKKDEQPLISRLNCQVETYGVKLNGFKIKGFTEEDDVNYGTSVTCKFRVSKNTVPGTYYGKVTASYKYKGRDCKSTQGFQIVVAGEGEVTLSSEVNGTEVIVSGPAEYFPEAEDLEIQVAEADEEQQMQVMEALQKKAEEEGTQIKDYRAFDIKLMAEGVETEPGGKLTVTFKNVKLEANAAEEAVMLAEEGPIGGEEAGTQENKGRQNAGRMTETGETGGYAGESIQVYHLDEEVTEVNEMATTTEGDGEVVMMETAHFSVYVVVLEADAQAYHVTFQHYTGEGNDLESYEKTFRDSWPKDKDGNRVPLGGPGEFSYIKVLLDPMIKAVEASGGYKAKTIKIFKATFDEQGNAQEGEETEESKKEAYKDIFSETSEDKEIPIKQDTIIRIYYEKVKKDEIIMDGVTFYDYDRSGPGINCTRNYPINCPMNKRLAAGNGHFSGENPAAMVQVREPNGRLTQKNANINNATQANGSNGYPIIQGIVTKLDDDGNPEMGNDLADPGFFTKESKIGKHIYPTEMVKTGLEFKRIGEEYELEFAVLDVPKEFHPYNLNDIKKNNVNNITIEELKDGETITGTRVKTKAGKENKEKFFPLDYLAPGNQIEVTNGGTRHNCFFGMRYEFTIDVGDYIGPLDYTFSGDDDLWLFLDGRLVLDLGGLHSTYPDWYGPEVRRWRNDVNLWWYLNHPDASYEAYDQDPDAKNAQCDLTKTYGTYKITILYMERGGGDSGCIMNFNMPRLTPVQVTPIMGDRTLKVKKVWNDGDSPYRPKNITVQLQRKSESENDSFVDVGQPITLSSDNDWSYSWQVDMNGYEYQVAEKTVLNEYDVSYSDLAWNVAANQYEITITNRPKDTKLAKAIKIWDDVEDQDRNRPDFVTMQLYWKKKGDNEAVWQQYQGKELVLDGESADGNGHWQGMITGLPKYMYEEDGSAFEVEYRFYEMHGGNGIESGGKLPGKKAGLNSYTVSYEQSSETEEGKSADITTVTNHYSPKTISQKVKKVWENVPAGFPVSAEIGLYRKSGDGYELVTDLPEIEGRKQENPIIVSKNCEYTWSNLPAYKAGNGIEYKVFETGYQESGEKKYIDIPGSRNWVLAEDGYLYQLKYDESQNSSGAADTVSTTITNTLQAATLRIKKIVAGGEKEDFKNNYKFLMEVERGDKTYTTVALKDGDTSGAIVVPFTAEDILEGKVVFQIRETVPMEYTLTGMTAGDFVQSPQDEQQKYEWDWDNISKIGTVTLKSGADVIVTVNNTMNHNGYFHHTASVTNVKQPPDGSNEWSVKTAPFKKIEYTEPHGEGNTSTGRSTDNESKGPLAFEAPYMGEERFGFKEKVLDEEVALYG